MFSRHSSERCRFGGGLGTRDYKVFRNAISARRSVSSSFNPYGCPFTAYVARPLGLHPVGT